MTEAGAGAAPTAGAVDMKLEVVVISVSDTERAREFYAKLGWRQDQTPSGSGIVQFTPLVPVARCSSAEIARRRRRDPRKDFG